MTRVAAIVTVYQEWAHGDALGTKFFAGTSTDEGFFPPEVEVSRPPPSGSPPSGSPPGATAQWHGTHRSNRPRVQVVSLYIDHILAADGDPNERPNETLRPTRPLRRRLRMSACGSASKLAATRRLSRSASASSSTPTYLRTYR